VPSSDSATVARFWAKVAKGDGCWMWEGNGRRDGYARFSIGGRMVPAHRFAYELAHGAIPVGIDIHHRCEEPGCVRPDHLEGLSFLRHQAVDEKAPWTTREIDKLRRLAPLGAAEISGMMGRTERSVRQMAHRMRISLRMPGQRRGLLLGQPRGVSFVEAVVRHPDLEGIREAVFAGDADIERMDRRVQLTANGAPLCPSCARRPQEIERTGLCEDCHTRELAHAHAMESDRAEADRHLDRERQRKHRRKAKAS